MERRLNQQKETLDLILSEYKRLDIKAPIDGTVITEVKRLAGCAIPSGGTILVIADLRKMVTKVNVEEKDIAKVEVGQKAKIFISALPHEEYGVLEGVVERIDHQAKNLSEKIVFEATVSINDTKIPLKGKKGEEKIFVLKPGLSVKVNIITPRKRILPSLLESFTRG